MYGPQKLVVALAAALLLPLVTWTAPALAFELVSRRTRASTSWSVPGSSSGSRGVLEPVRRQPGSGRHRGEIAAAPVPDRRRRRRDHAVRGGRQRQRADVDQDRVTHNLGALQQGIARVAPGQSVTAATVDQSLVLTGTVATPDEATNILQVASQFVDDPTRVVNRMTVAAPTQVNLQVRIAEVARNVDRQLGIRWNADRAPPAAAASASSAARACPASGYSVDVGLTRGVVQHRRLLQALAEEGLVTIMAEPNLTARSGETGPVPGRRRIPLLGRPARTANTIDFKDYGIGLNFTPTVMDGNRISLKVATEVSELDFANNRRHALAQHPARRDHGRSRQRPELRHRRADAEQLVAEAAKMPALGTVPVLGALFRSNSFKRGQTELGDHRDPDHRHPGDRQADRDAGRRSISRRTTSSASCSAASRATRGDRDAEPHRQASAASASPASCSSERESRMAPHPNFSPRRTARSSSPRSPSPAARRSRSAPSTAELAADRAVAQYTSIFQPGHAALAAGEASASAPSCGRWR